MLLAAVTVQSAQALSPDIVISQVYGGGGNAGAPYQNDFVELFNRGTTTVSLSGMSVQYASATGTGNFGTNPIAALSGSLAPGQYYLVQLAGGTTGVSPADSGRNWNGEYERFNWQGRPCQFYDGASMQRRQYRMFCRAVGAYQGPGRFRHREFLRGRSSAYAEQHDGGTASCQWLHRN